MAGIEKITKEILSAADAEANDIIAKAEQDAAAAVEAAKKACDNSSLAAKQKSDKKAAELAIRLKSQCEQESKQIKLKTKQNLITEVLEKALEKLKAEDAETYFAKLLKLLPDALESGEGVLYLSKEDLARKPADFEAKAMAVAAEKGKSITFAKEAADIKSGFLLKYGDIEINSSYEAIFEEKKDILQDVVNKNLW